MNYAFRSIRSGCQLVAAFYSALVFCVTALLLALRRTHPSKHGSWP